MVLVLRTPGFAPLFWPRILKCILIMCVCVYICVYICIPWQAYIPDHSRNYINAFHTLPCMNHLDPFNRCQIEKALKIQFPFTNASSVLPSQSRMLPPSKGFSMFLIIFSPQRHLGAQLGWDLQRGCPLQRSGHEGAAGARTRSSRDIHGLFWMLRG